MSLSRVWLFVTPWTVALQVPLSMGILQARILEWIFMPFSRRYSQPRDWTQVSHILGRLFTIWTTREVQTRIPPLQSDSLPSEPPGKNQETMFGVVDVQSLISEVAQSTSLVIFGLILVNSLWPHRLYSPPGSSLHGIFQARILEWAVISFSRRYSQPRVWTWVSHIVGRCFTLWATREVLQSWSLS